MTIREAFSRSSRNSPMISVWSAEPQSRIISDIADQSILIFSLRNHSIARTIRSFAPIERIFVNNADEYTALVGNVRLTFLRYPFPFEYADSFEDILPLPNLTTLGAMKLFALGRRAKWKDYVDLFFIMKDHHALPELFAQAKVLFGAEMNEKILREELSYFNDIDYSESVSYLSGFETPDDTICDFLTKASIA